MLDKRFSTLICRVLNRKGDCKKMKHKFNTLQFSASLVKFWLRPTLRKNRGNFTILGLTETLRKATEILINTILTKTTENLNAWRVVKISAKTDHKQVISTYQGYYIYVASWKLEASWKLRKLT